MWYGNEFVSFDISLWFMWSYSYAYNNCMLCMLLTLWTNQNFRENQFNWHVFIHRIEMQYRYFVMFPSTLTFHLVFIKWTNFHKYWIQAPDLYQVAQLHSPMLTATGLVYGNISSSTPRRICPFNDHSEICHRWLRPRLLLLCKIWWKSVHTWENRWNITIFFIYTPFKQLTYRSDCSPDFHVRWLKGRRL